MRKMAGVKRATMTDVAKRAGVSQTTVSFVLNDIDAGLPERTKKKVLEAARELNYSPNDAARRLASRKSHALGLAIYDIGDIVDYTQAAAVVLASVYRAAERRSHRLAVFTTHERAESGEDLETYFAVPVRSHEVDGVIVWDYYVDGNKLLSGFRDGLPIVTLDRQVMEVPCVVPDYDHGLQEIVDALVRKGHERLCLLTHSEKVYRDVKVRSAFDRAVRRAGIRAEEVTFKEEPRVEPPEDGIVEKIVDEILDMRERPTAVICAYDKSAIATLMQLRRRGIAVPKEMAVVGCAGLPVTAHEAFSLSTLDLRQDLMGTHAVDLVIGMVRGEDLSGTHVLVQPQFVERGTT